MMRDVERAKARVTLRLSRQKSARRISFLVTASLAALFTFTSPIAFQDVASLLSHDSKAARWSAFSVPSAVGSVEAATIAFADGTGPNGAGLQSRIDAASAVAEKQAEQVMTGGIRSAEKGARVISLAPRMMQPPRGFSAGSIMERQSMLGPRVIGGGERIRSAFSKITPAVKDAMVVAANFKLKGAPPELRGGKGTTEGVMVASLEPAIPDTNALGYAGTTNDLSARASLFEKILKDTPDAFIPPISGKDHSWAAQPLPASTLSAKEQSCLAKGLYFEARGESTMGQAAVGQVILNRVRNPAYPNTICGVVYQNRSWRNRCQFSFACDGILDRITDQGAWARAKRVAEQVTKGEIWINEVGSATHYHANYVRPRWASAMERVDKIGKHIFYRTFNGGW